MREVLCEPSAILRICGLKKLLLRRPFVSCSANAVGRRLTKVPEVAVSPLGDSFGFDPCWPVRERSRLSNMRKGCGLAGRDCDPVSFALATSFSPSAPLAMTASFPPLPWVTSFSAGVLLLSSVSVMRSEMRTRVICAFPSLRPLKICSRLAAAFF